jgi:hypothetical protein
MTGTYKLSFTGKATIGQTDVTNVVISNQQYNAGANMTTADVTLNAGNPALIFLTFTDTQRTPTFPLNSGITNLKFIRPGYAANTTQIFTDRLLTALEPFAYLRFMDVLGTNEAPGFYGDPGNHLLTWAERSLPSDSTQQSFQSLREGKRGLAWEYVILLANETQKDIWINIPVSATGDNPNDTTSYIYKLATLLRNGNAFTGNEGLDPNLKIYVEYGNELWNYQFLSTTWNKLAAIDEVGQGGSPLNNDGSTDDEIIKIRREAKRLREIALIFEKVFGNNSLNTRIRPVFASWWRFPNTYMGGILNWTANTYGNPSDYFYAIGASVYFGDGDLSNTGMSGASIQDILDEMRAESIANRAQTVDMRTIADMYDLKLFAYEGGPDNGGGQTGNLGNRILANRAPAMEDLMVEHISDSWFELGGDMYGAFSLWSMYSRFGSWGLTDSLENLDTPKYQALYHLTGAHLDQRLYLPTLQR